MIERFSIKNFRCFRELQMDQLGRVNLIMGRNNAGKSALLEALFVHQRSHRADVGLSLRGVDDHSDDSHEIWGWLFLNRETSSSIELLSQRDDVGERRVRMFLDSTAAVQIPGGNESLASGAAELGRDTDRRPFVIERSTANSGLEETMATVVRSGVAPVTTVRNQLTPWQNAVFIGAEMDIPHNLHVWFSNLESQKREEELLEPLRTLEPRLKRLSLRALPRTRVFIQADLGGKELVPLPVVGDGMSRLLSHLLAVAEAKNEGLALLDEVENGIHYSALAGMWKAIAEAARRSNTQVFATTHSLECVAAAHEAFKESGIYDLRVHRLDLDDDGTHHVATFDEKKLETALNHNWEVR